MYNSIKKCCTTSIQILNETLNKILHKTLYIGLYNLYNVVQPSLKRLYNSILNIYKYSCSEFHEILLNCTTKHKLLYNLGQYVQYCTKPCTISLSNPFFSCTTFQVVYGVQPFVQYCTTYVQRCTKLYRLYRLYNLLYNIVTVWFADVVHYIACTIRAL